MMTDEYAPRKDFIEGMKKAYDFDNHGDNFSAKSYNEMINDSNKLYDNLKKWSEHRGDRRK